MSSLPGPSTSGLLGCGFVALGAGTETLRQRLLIRPGFGDFGSVATAAEIEACVESTQLRIDAIERSGPMIFLEASPA